MSAPTSSGSPVERALAGALRAWAADSVLAIGEPAVAASRAHAATRDRCTVETLAAGGSAPSRRFDAAVAASPGPPDRDLKDLLGRVRALCSPRVGIAWPAAPRPGTVPDPDLIALGFVRHAADPDRRHELYTFDLDAYKPTPDWLNARHWANPERWDRERW